MDIFGTKMRLWYISLPWATFGLIEQDQVIVDTAPIAKWAIGKLAADVFNYYKRKQAKIELVEEF